MTEKPMLEISHYSKTYGGGKKAVDDVSLAVMPGDIYGFIGHNGAGKSTTIRAVVGVLDFTEGDIFIDGHSVKDEPMACKRVTTGVLNDVLNEATSALQPPLQGGRRLKIYYATQHGVCPPTFIFFVNDEKLMFFAYERYLENYFRKSFDFTGTPIRFVLRQRKKEGN